MGSSTTSGVSRDAIFLPRLKTQTPPEEPGRTLPHAAKTLSCHAKVAVIISGVSGLEMNTRFRPRLKSYVCRERPTEVVIWKVALPKRTVVKGTEVGDTSPKV